MYSPRYIQYFNLPQIPTEITDDLLSMVPEITKNTIPRTDSYTWSDYHNQAINAWCNQNICQEMYWGFQLITGDLDAHVDNGTKIKINYLLTTGGSNVITRFWNDNRTAVLDEYVIPVNRWHIFKADSVHEVIGIEQGCLRFSITGRIFGDMA